MSLFQRKEGDRTWHTIADFCRQRTLPFFPKLISALIRLGATAIVFMAAARGTRLVVRTKIYDEEIFLLLS
jgi:hypothetical protein